MGHDVVGQQDPNREIVTRSLGRIWSKLALKMKFRFPVNFTIKTGTERNCQKIPETGTERNRTEFRSVPTQYTIYSTYSIQKNLLNTACIK